MSGLLDRLKDLAHAWETRAILPDTAEHIQVMDALPLLLDVVEAARSWRQAEYAHGKGSREPDPFVIENTQEAFWAALARLDEGDDDEPDPPYDPKLEELCRG